jgi:signal transduction histidine kinase
MFKTRLKVKTHLKGQLQGKWLNASVKQQKRLRKLTHQVLAAQEEERIKISHELQDEIAQNLLSINVRLLLLRQAARTKAKGLKNDIAGAQQLVVKSVKSIRRLARELNNHRQTLSERLGTAS